MSTIPRITSVYKIYSDFVKVDLPKSSDAFTEIVSITDFGVLYSAGLNFNNRNIILRCEVDTTEIFEVNINAIYDMLSQNDTPTNTSMVMGFEDSRDLFTFKPSSPLMFRSSIKFFAKASTNSTSRDFESALIEYTRE